MRRINHAQAYSRDRVHTNFAESFFSRLRRMIGGQHLKVDGRYLDAYATHAAWLEDHRKESNGCLADRLTGRALAVPVSRAWKGIGNDAQRDAVPWRPDAHAFTLCDHPDELAASGVAEGLDDLEHDRVA